MWDFFGRITGSNKNASALSDPHAQHHKVLKTHFKKLPKGVTLQTERLAIGAVFQGWQIEGSLCPITSSSRNIVLGVRSSINNGIAGALKFPSPKHLIAVPTEAATFDQERQLTRNLAHKNLAGALEDGVVAGLPYLITERFHYNFADPIPDSDTSTVWGIIAQAATGIDHMHTTQGWIHGDIKSGNIMVTKRRNGRLIAKVIDFGSATPIDINKQTAKVFTPAYARPGVKYGSPKTTHDDTYALVVTLVERLEPTLRPFLTTISTDEDQAYCQEMLNIALNRLVRDSHSIPDYIRPALLAALHTKNPTPPALKSLIPLFEKAANGIKR
ncbi:protein kinase [Candidatus Gracilibacteria bacterium]|nr:protein kinase [Candidatus Gracilibacteria bacterium]